MFIDFIDLFVIEYDDFVKDPVEVEYLSPGNTKFWFDRVI